MAPLTPQQRRLAGRPARVTSLPQRLRRTVPQAFDTSGRTGPVAELFLTRLLPLLTQLAQRILEVSII